MLMHRIGKPEVEVSHSATVSLTMLLIQIVSTEVNALTAPMRYDAINFTVSADGTLFSRQMSRSYDLS